MAKSRELVFVPSICKGEGAKFEGKIVLKSLDYYTRMDFLKSFQVKVTDDKQVELPETTADRVEMMTKLVKASEPLYLKVELKNKETSEVWESFEDLSYDPQMTPLLTEVALFLINGNQLGNG